MCSVIVHLSQGLAPVWSKTEQAQMEAQRVHVLTVYLETDLTIPLSV